MHKFDIYCLSVNEYEFFKYLPKNIIPLILNNKITSSKYLYDNNGLNINYLNKYYGELTGIFWVFKNLIHYYNDYDRIGFCQYRRFFLNDVYYHNYKNINTNLFSKLLVKKTDIFNLNETIMIKPTIHKNENLYDHFKNNHDEKVLQKSFELLNNEDSILFRNYLLSNEYSICNMFVTKVYIFKKYCNFVFPLLEKILDFCLKEGLCSNINTRLPAFFIERFTSYWFLKNSKVGYLSFALLDNYFMSNYLNKFYNTLKTPYSFRHFPTILDV